MLIYPSFSNLPDVLEKEIWGQSSIVKDNFWKAVYVLPLIEPPSFEDMEGMKITYVTLTPSMEIRFHS